MTTISPSKIDHSETVSIESFKQRMADHGFDPGGIIPDATIHRFPTWGDRTGEASGAYWHNGNVGWFQDHRTMEKPIVVKGKLLKADQKALNNSFSGANNKVSRKTLEEGIRRIWTAGEEPGGHPYLKNKGIKVPLRMIKQYKGRLVIPVFGIDNELNGLQIIDAKGRKRFLAGTKKKGSFFSIPGNETHIICEGFSTGVSLHEATGATIIVAFDAGNLFHVAKVISKKVNPKEIIIAGDNDDWKLKKGQRNIGADMAQKAAQEIGAKIILPKFKKNKGKITTDFNDLYKFEGLKVLKQQVESVQKATAQELKVKDGWGNPVDIFSEKAIIAPQWKGYFSPDVIGDFGYDCAERMGVRPEQVIGPAIINTAGVINVNFMLQPKEHDNTWNEPAILNAAIIGESGSKKSPSKHQVDKVINKIQGERYEAYKRELEAFKQLSEEEQKAYPKPTIERIVCSDTTIEALRDILKDEAGTRKVICSWDEMSGWLGSFDSYRASKQIAKDRPAFIELYEGRPKQFDRVSSGYVFVPSWAACICGTITPDAMTKYFGQLNTDGLLQRILLYQAERTGSGIDRKPNKMILKRFEKTIIRLAELRPNSKIIYKLDEQAQEIREVFERLVEVAKYLPGATEAFKVHLNKYPGIFCRLSLTYHIADTVAAGVEPPMRLPGKIAEMAASALIDYHMPLARNFYKTLGYESKVENAAGDVCGYILAHKCCEISTQDIIRNVRSLKNKIQEARNVMEMLETYDWVKISKTIGGFKPTRWIVNPTVHKIFQEQARAEKKRRQEARANMGKAIEIFNKHEKGESNRK